MVKYIPILSRVENIPFSKDNYVTSKAGLRFF